MLRPLLCPCPKLSLSTTVSKYVPVPTSLHIPNCPKICPYDMVFRTKLNTLITCIRPSYLYSVVLTQNHHLNMHSNSQILYYVCHTATIYRPYTLFMFIRTPALSSHQPRRFTHRVACHLKDAPHKSFLQA